MALWWETQIVSNYFWGARAQNVNTVVKWNEMRTHFPMQALEKKNKERWYPIIPLDQCPHILMEWVLITEIQLRIEP